MTEAQLVTSLVKALQERLPGAVVFKHSDRATAGIPDVSVTWYNRTTWLEIKLVSPDLYRRTLQDLMMRRLDRVSAAYYVIFREQPEPVTEITIPGCTVPEVSCPGLKPAFVADYLRERWNTST